MKQLFTSIKLKDVVFATRIYNTDAQVCKDSGINCLYVPTSRKVYMLPPGTTIDDEYLGETVEITVREATDKVLWQPCQNDATDEDKQRDSRILFVQGCNSVESLYTEVKEGMLKKTWQYLGTVVGSFLLSLICRYYSLLQSATRLHKLADVYSTLIVLSAVFGVMFGLIPLVVSLVKATSPVVEDANGSTINMKTGASTLNGGMVFSETGVVDSL